MCRKGWQQPIRVFWCQARLHTRWFLSCDFFNILMEKIICAAGLRHTGTIFYKSIMPLAYADDVDINTDNDISREIRRRITLANRCYFGQRKQLSKKALSWRTKICLYKSLILPVLLYGGETWTLTSSDEQALGVFERKILHKIYGPFCDRGKRYIRWNQELYDINDDIDIVKRIKIQRLRWLGHVSPMDSSNPVRKVFESKWWMSQTRTASPAVGQTGEWESKNAGYPKLAPSCNSSWCMTLKISRGQDL